MPAMPKGQKVLEEGERNILRVILMRFCENISAPPLNPLKIESVLDTPMNLMFTITHALFYIYVYKVFDIKITFWKMKDIVFWCVSENAIVKNAIVINAIVKNAIVKNAIVKNTIIILKLLKRHCIIINH